MLDPNLSWLQPRWQQLAAYKAKNCLPSGIMLQGLPGIGKLAFATAYAAFILCERQNSQPCGQCRPCVLFQAGNHPDFFLIKPQDGSSTIKIEQIRELTDSLAQTCALSGHQVAIISKAEQMNRAGANALLKTLEEPQGRVLIILVSDRSLAVPATVRSRCQQITMPIPTTIQAKEWLMQQLPGEGNAATYLALSDNLPLNAFDLAQNKQLALRNQLLDVLIKIKSEQLEPSHVASEFVEHMENVVNFLCTIVTDLIRIKFNFKQLHHQDSAHKLLNICHSLVTAQLFTFLDSLFEMKRLIMNKTNINQQMLLENMFIKWHRL